MTDSSPPQPASATPPARGLVRRLFFRPRVFRLAALFLFLTAFGGGLWVWHSVPDPLNDVLYWPVSPVMLDREGGLVHARLSARDEWCLPVPLAEMGDWLPKVLVAVEDKRFYSHSGVDLLALCRAVVQNVTSGRVVSGASTITSQLVRLSNPRSRTMSTKLLEFVGAWKLERSLGKKEILEYYLNRAPFGGTIRGVEAAARMYFGKRAKELSLGEASLLVGLLKGPTAYRPDRNPKAALRRRQMIIKTMAANTGLDADLAALALEEPLPVYKPAMPVRAWHFADLVFKTLPPTGGVARSTLSIPAQDLLEQSLSEQLTRAGEGVTAAGLVVDNASGEILAYTGNVLVDPTRGRHWVDCAISPRSPGSTLKPFVYLEAMEEGNIVPATLLADTPLRLGGEAPRNFDRRYRGPVTVHTALADSLNAPAVRVLRMLGVRKALKSLRDSGFTHLNRTDDDYGDSLVLGAGEVTALELARAYTTLANLGMDRPLVLRKSPGSAAARRSSPVNLERYGSTLPAAPQDQDAGEEPRPGADPLVVPPGAYCPPGWGCIPAVRLPGGLANVPRQLAAAVKGILPVPKRLHSEEGAYLVAEILKDPGRLPFLVQLVQAREEAPIAFKTGTSFGLRDAWTAAYTPSHTVVVWFGKEKGGADTRLVGISMAAPPAIKILRGLGNVSARPARPAWYAKPEGISMQRVCALSGAVASPYCPSTRFAPVITSVWRTRPCDMHLLREGKTALVWPPELEDFTRLRFAKEDLSRSAVIVSPMPGAEYILTPGAVNQPLPLKAEGVAYPVHWYVDGSHMGKQEREDLPLYWQPSNGVHSISLLDAEERIATLNVTVRDLAAP